MAVCLHRGRQPGVAEVALDAAPGALGDFVFDQGGEETGGGPTLLVCQVAGVGSAPHGRKGADRRHSGGLHSGHLDSLGR